MYENTQHAELWQIDDIPYADRMGYKNPYEALSAMAQQRPTAPALTFQLKTGPKDPAITMNWEEFRARTAQCANAFRALGIGENDVVAYVMPNCLEVVVANQGGATAGIVNPINPVISPEHIGGILNETGAKVVVTLAPFPKAEVAQTVIEALQYAPNVETVLTVDLLRYLKPPLAWLIPLLRPKVTWPSSVKVMDFNTTLDAHNTELDFEQPAEDRIAAYFHTGGTTGRPKVARHLQSGMMYNGWVGRELIFTPDDVAICPLPMFHVMAAYPVLMSCILTGSHFVMVAPAGYRAEGIFENFWKLVERYKVSFLVTVPTAAARLMTVPIDADISSLRIGVSGSAPFPKALFERFETATGLRILEGYGMTEATCMVSINPFQGDRKVGSVGYPMPYTDVRIYHFDADNNVTRECDVDEVGEICVLNPGVWSNETYRDPDNNIGNFANGTHLRTGDLGRIDADNFLWITGRAKDLIIRGGHNIDPAMIEDALASHPAIGFVGAIGQPDAYSGEVPAAYVELVEGATITQEELQAYAEQHIPEKAAIPKYVEILDELPKTAVGKVFKPDLRKRAISRVLAQEFAEAGIDANIEAFSEDKKRGLVAHIHATGDAKTAIEDVMGRYMIAYDVDQKG